MSRWKFVRRLERDRETDRSPHWWPRRSPRVLLTFVGSSALDAMAACKRFLLRLFSQARVPPTPFIPKARTVRTASGRDFLHSAAACACGVRGCAAARQRKSCCGALSSPPPLLLIISYRYPNKTWVNSNTQLLPYTLHAFTRHLSTPLISLLSHGGSSDMFLRHVRRETLICPTVSRWPFQPSQKPETCTLLTESNKYRIFERVVRTSPWYRKQPPSHGERPLCIPFTLHGWPIQKKKKSLPLSSSSDIHLSSFTPFPFRVNGWKTWWRVSSWF